MIIHIKYVKPTPTKGSRLMTMEAPGQVLTLPSPKSGPAQNLPAEQSQTFFVFALR